MKDPVQGALYDEEQSLWASFPRQPPTTEWEGVDFVCCENDYTSGQGNQVVGRVGL